MANERLEAALKWAESKKMKSKQLNLFNKLYQSKRAKQKKQDKPVVTKGMG